MDSFSEEVIEYIQRGKIGVIPTDTLYGLVGSALQLETVERMYEVRKRDLDKPFIILIARKEDMRRFGVAMTPEQEIHVDKWWPGKVSVLLPCEDETFRYLHRGKKTLAFRCPAQRGLCDLLERTGPLVVPSANPQGVEPAKTLEEAAVYFGDQVDFYVDGGVLNGEPSTLLSLENDRVHVIRRGAVEVE